jgi:hypothetical protein
VKVGVAHSLRPRHRPKYGMRSEFSRRATELLKQSAELLDIRREFYWPGSTLSLIQFRACLDAVGPMKRHPQRRPLVDRAFEERGRSTDALFAYCRAEGIAEMTNHLMSRHAPPTPLAVGMHLAQAIEHFALVATIKESFHPLDVHSTPSSRNHARVDMSPACRLDSRDRGSWRGRLNGPVGPGSSSTGD